MDGVIIDSEPLHDRASKIVFEQESRKSGELIQADLIAFRGRTERDLWTHIRNVHSLLPSIEELSRREEENFRSVLRSESNVYAMDGVVALATEFHASYPLALASSSSHIVIGLTLSRLQIQSLFDVIVSGDDVERGKPAPDIFLLAAKKLGIAPSNCLVIEDSKHGVSAAKAAGMYCLGFKGTPHNKHDLSLADQIIDSFQVVQAGKLLEAFS